MEKYDTNYPLGGYFFTVATGVAEHYIPARDLRYFLRGTDFLGTESD